VTGSVGSGPAGNGADGNGLAGLVPDGEPCAAAELRTLFLFEKLADDQLDWLCREGRVQKFEPGTVYSEREPAENLYVLLSGTIALYRAIGADEVEVNRTSARGVYGGAFFAYLGDRAPQVYNNSMRAIEPSRFFVLAAERFAQLMTDWFPMAVHLLEGLFFGTRNTQEAIGQRERLLALGSLSAGLTHELNNPAAAAARATGALRQRLGGLREGLAGIAAGPHDGKVLAELLRLQGEAAEQVSGAPALSPLEASDREDEIADWLDEHDIGNGWEMASTFVQSGITPQWLDSAVEKLRQAAPDSCDIPAALRWLGDSLDAELLVSEIADSVTRVSTLVGAARQYSQLDRAPYQVVDLHELLDSTLVMLAGKIGPDITVVKHYDRSLPRVPCYPAELNQVWTNLIDNAIDAMAGKGTLTITTSADGDRALVEIADTGPGIPEDLQERIFEPFFTTKPVGQGTGLGLDISWRIIVTRHHGDLRVQSVPGNTRFRAWLPLEAADPPGGPEEAQEPAAG
jgi:signal transduction histidine kinase